GPAPSPPDPAPLSLHDALPISRVKFSSGATSNLLIVPLAGARTSKVDFAIITLATSCPSCTSSPSFTCHSSRSASTSSSRSSHRSEEHTSELQSRGHPVCRLLL